MGVAKTMTLKIVTITRNRHISNGVRAAFRAMNFEFFYYIRATIRFRGFTSNQNS
jgi:hypothetical protein